METLAAKKRIVEKAGVFVEDYLNKHLEDYILYHNVAHTKSVVSSATIIGKEVGLTDAQMETVILAAWFHDTGYHKSCEHHEKYSVEIARSFLSQEAYPEDQIDRIAQAIMATKMPQEPTTLEGEVLCDADLYHLSTEHFFDMSENLRKEFSTFNEELKDEEAWYKKSISFLEEHRYFTPYGKEVLDPRKQANVAEMKARHKKAKKENKKFQKLQEKNQKLADKLEQKPDKGIETMFRTTYRSHLDLSNIADNKANIMLSINSIIVSLVVSILIRKFEDFPNLIIPTIILISVNLLTIIFSVLATRPNVTSGKFTREDVKSRRTNLLFFGNFHKMSLDDYEWGMREIMKDADRLYGNMIRDIYFLGLVLARKYKLLRIAYTIFMFGFVISVLAFIIAMVYFPSY